jgi:hypothetical protein
MLESLCFSLLLPHRYDADRDGRLPDTDGGVPVLPLLMALFSEQVR